MYQFHLKISKINEKVKNFISSVTLTSYFEVAWNKRLLHENNHIQNTNPRPRVCILYMVVFMQ